ncbi:MAG: hypothetical protein JHC26_08005 [Thermofilum sp.]|jgi:uncharacterized membrane protein YqhA|uniref:hypothetical protein n=1 Tax=Thermofilum sp. TaxID=1961369 RepID=UPI002589CC04|nr:hypothetical protein [Thermofilum sp.]MCI4409021.1 hypothetical protein [Thermofilum sp.]
MEHVKLNLETYIVLIAVFAGAFTSFILYQALVMHKPIMFYGEVKCLNTSECDLLAHMMGKTVGIMVEAVMLGVLFLILVTATLMSIFNRRGQNNTYHVLTDKFFV